MHVTLATKTIDLAGYRRIKINPANFFELFGLEKRGTVTPTLDGGAVPFDAGAVYAGKTMTIRAAEPDEDVYIFFRHLCEYYTEIILHCYEGSFTVFPEKAFYQGSYPNLKITVISKRSS